MQHSSCLSSTQTGSHELPLWSGESSPYGPVWSEIIEHRSWFSHFPDRAPFSHPSRLGFLVLRRRPDQIPRVLCKSDVPFPDSPLAEVIELGPDGIDDKLKRVNELDVRAALSSTTRDASDLFALLSPAADRLRTRLLMAATRHTRSRFGKVRKIYAPLYLSNACTNRCAYCGFSFDNEVERRTLNLTETEAEAEILAARGFDSVLLLTGEAPRITSVHYLEKMVFSLARRFRNVGLEVFPMGSSDYARLQAAGANSVTIYQETYDPLTYRSVHQAGRKRDMLWRLDAPERVLQAGIKNIGMGALLGLAPWRFEAIALGLHVRALQQRYKDVSFSLSFPRLTPAQGAQPASYPVEEAALLHMMAALRLCLPDVEFVLSTRESARLRDRLAPLLVTRLSAGSSTTPGGYSRPASSRVLAQFSMEDERPVEEVRRALRDKGLVI